MTEPLLPLPLTNSAGKPLAFVMVVGGYPPAQRAGMEYGCQRLSEGLARRGHPVTVITTRVSGMARDTFEGGVRVLRVLKPLPLGPLWGVSYRRQVRRWLTALLPDWDVVMSHQLYLHSHEATRVARTHGRRSCHLLVAAQEYSDLASFAGIRGGRRLLEECVRSTDGLFVLSAFSRRELEDIGVPSGRIHSYRYFVDTGSFTPGTAVPERELLCLGRWHRQKNLPLLLEAFDRFAADVPGVRLRIVGAGPEEASLRAALEGLSHPDRVTVEGWAADPRDVYRRAWAVVTSSDAEGLSNVLIEALASGTPVITTDVSGAREALDLEDTDRHAVRAGSWLRGTGGLLVPMRDAAALASAMTEIVRTPGLRTQLSSEARSRAVSTFSEEASVTRFLHVIRHWFSAAESGSLAHARADLEQIDHP
jgi:glycosyltransferase involved in cell wall biosynthesis